MSQTVLVTGGAGYVGSHACKALAAHGYLPVTYDNLSQGHRWAVKWGPLEEGDLTDLRRLKKVMTSYPIDAVLHFAACASVEESMQDPQKYYHNNVVGTLALLECMKQRSVQKIVFSSSCTVYGIPKQVPIQENHPMHPVSSYGASKSMMERMIGDFSKAYGISHICLRYFNVSGADPDAEIGEVHDPETHLIPLILGVAAKRRPSLSLFGSDYETPDGTCIRDYIHVSDLVEAHLLALQRLEEGKSSSIYNLGNGCGFSVKEVLEMSRLVTRSEIPAILAPRRPGDPPILVADATRAMQELGWKPRYASLETQLTHAWHWYQKYYL